MQMLTIAGNIGRDAELRSTPSGDSVAGFSVAVDNGKDKNGNRRDSTWFDCSLWGKRASALAPYLLKGGKVTITGRPTVRVHNEKAYLGVSVDNITLQGSANGGQSQGNQNHDAPQGGGSRDLGDEIPFAPEWRV